MCVCVQGPFYVAQMFLEHVPKAEQTHHHRKLKICFKEFTRRYVCVCVCVWVGGWVGIM